MHSFVAMTLKLLNYPSTIPGTGAYASHRVADMPVHGSHRYINFLCKLGYFNDYTD